MASKLLDEAVRLVLGERRCTAQLLQRRLWIGYVGAANLIDEMAAVGVVGRFSAKSKGWPIKMTLDEWNATRVAPMGDLDREQNDR